MPRGRKPTPTALKLLKGTRSDRINQDEPKAVEGTPDCPRHLDRIAKAEWRRIVPELQALGVLSRTDGAALALYCETHSQWLNAVKTLRKEGHTVACGNGGTKAHPAVNERNIAASQLRAMLAEFGLTPATRSRLKSGRSEKPRDALADFLAKKRG